jgi:hypothetical protein
MRRARPYRGENHGPGKDVQGELDLTPGIREQPGSLPDLAARRRDVRFAPDNGHRPSPDLCPLKGHVWTAPGWQEESSRRSIGRSSHVFGLLARLT